MKILYTLPLLFLSLFLNAQYCEYTGDCSGDWINEVVVNNYKNKSTGCQDGYVDYSDSLKFYILPSGSFDVSIDWESFSNTAGYFWIDWDKSETWEITERGVIAYSGSTNGTLTVTVPEGVAAGDVLKMRTMLANAADPPDPCTGSAGLYNVDEVEDYEILVVDKLPGGATDYCDARGNDCAFGHIAKVEFAGVTNASGCTFYGDYTDTTAFKVDPGTDETITVTWAGQGTAYNYLMAAWIDYNQDKVFSDDEMTAIPSGGLGVSSGPISIPADAPQVITRMRIRMVQNAAPAPCGDQSRGEVEDYTIIIGTPPPSCAKIVSPSMGFQGICQEGAELKWKADEGGETPNGYKLWVGTDNPPSTIENGFDMGVNTSYQIAQKLDPATNYYWQVVPYNDKGDANSCPVWQFTSTTKGDPQPDVIFDRNSVDSVVSCKETDVTLFATIFGGVGTMNYTWSGDIAKLNQSDKDSAVVNASELGVYTFKIAVEDELGCKGEDSVVVEIVDKALAGFIDGDLRLCNYDTLRIATPASFGNLQWQRSSDGSNWLDLTGQTSPLYTNNNPETDISYRLLASTEHCFDTSNVLSVTVFDPVQTPEILSDNEDRTVCPGDSVQLYSSVAGGNYWSTGSTEDTIWIKNPSEVTVYRQDQNACISETNSAETFNYPLPNKPVINEAVNGEAALCEGNTLLLTTTKEQGTKIKWIDDPNLKSNQIIVQDPGLYYLSVESAQGCFNYSDTITVEVRNNPAKEEITIEADTNFICNGDSLFISIDSPLKLAWNNIQADNETRFKVSEPGSYFARITDEFGCFNYSDTVEIFVFENPDKPRIQIGTGGNEFCEGDSVRLKAISESPFYWMGDTAIKSAVIYSYESSSYFLTAENEFGCKAQSDTISTVQHPNPPTPEIISEDGDLICSVTGYMIQWHYVDGFPVDSGNQRVLENAIDGNYYVSLTDSITGCSSRSEVFTDVFTRERDLVFKVYPNPVDLGDVVNISGNSQTQIGRISVVNTLGQEVLSSTNSNKISTLKLEKGAYLILIYDTNQYIVQYSTLVIR